MRGNQMGGRCSPRPRRPSRRTDADGHSVLDVVVVFVFVVVKVSPSFLLPPAGRVRAVLLIPSSLFQFLFYAVR